MSARSVVSRMFQERAGTLNRLLKNSSAVPRGGAVAAFSRNDLELFSSLLGVTVAHTLLRLEPGT